MTSTKEPLSMQADLQASVPRDYGVRIRKGTFTLEGLAPQSFQESLVLFPATLVLREAVLATGGRLELLFEADGAGATYVLPSTSALILSR